MERELYDRRASIVKALAHPSRLMMVDALAGGEKCVCELQTIVGAEMSTVSKHLAVLKQAGLIADRKEGLWVHYRLICPCLPTFFECIDDVLKSDAEARQRAVELAGQRGA